MNAGVAVIDCDPVLCGGVMKNKVCWSSVTAVGKDPTTNTSMDSGVAGLRDTPVHITGPVHTTNVNSSVNKNSLDDVPKFIVDHSTRTTYMKGKFLGKGGFARVHELTDLTTNKTYAGKIIPKCRITKPQHKEKMAREIEVHRLLRHRHVVRFHHYFEDDTNVYIILENCSRKSLVHVLKHRRVLTEPEVRYCLRQLIEGVAYIHSQGVIHRDLKLGNMFLTEEMHVKVGDFGLATRSSEHRNVTICGTPNYIAPEVLNKQGHSFEADIWAMGCIMYALLVGQPPFETVTLTETYSRITSNNYAIPPLVSESARSLIRRFLHPDPGARPRLETVLTHEFFTSGIIPRTLSPSACEQMPKFGIEAIGKSASMPEGDLQEISQDVKKIITSVSTLRIPNQKPQPNKVSVVYGDVQNAVQSPRGQLTSPKDYKKETAGILSSCLRQKLSSVICAAADNKSVVGGLALQKKRPTSSGTLYNLLAACLDSMPDTVTRSPSLQVRCPLFISKWIDYSNKYGFGHQLSDSSVGVFFNDLTRIAMSPDKSHVEFHDCSGRLTTHQVNNLPAWLQERYQLLLYFSSYMEENLTEAGDNQYVHESHSRTPEIPHIRRWDRTSKSIIMQLSNGNFQINFLKDHTKVAMAADQMDVLVLFINSERQSQTYRLSNLAETGCDPLVRERLIYALSCLRQYAELDGEEV